VLCALRPESILGSTSACALAGGITCPRPTIRRGVSCVDPLVTYVDPLNNNNNALPHHLAPSAAAAAAAQFWPAVTAAAKRTSTIVTANICRSNGQASNAIRPQSAVLLSGVVEIHEKFKGRFQRSSSKFWGQRHFFLHFLLFSFFSLFYLLRLQFLSWTCVRAANPGYSTFRGRAAALLCSGAADLN
jgi:hypothetical protein